MENYLQAARRHLESGDVLDAAGQVVDSSHLWAYGAECAIKAILERVNGTRSFPWVHINDHLLPMRSGRPPKADLVGIFNAAMTGRSSYSLPNALFFCWTVASRYDDGTDIKFFHQAHKSDRDKVIGVLEQALLGADRIFP